MNNITEPLRLAVGSHEAGSGKGCAMNIVSWENGDTAITDLPECSDRMLARIVQRANDSICSHRDGDLLCAECSVKALSLAHRTVGTAGHLKGVELQRAYVRVAADQARQVAHLSTDERVMAAIVAAERWANEPSLDNRNTAAAANTAAANAAYAAYAANAANAAAAAANAAYAAYAAATANAAYAAYAANAANAAAERLRLAHRAIDQFIELTGITPTTVEPERTAKAVERMMATS